VLWVDARARKLLTELTKGINVKSVTFNSSLSAAGALDKEYAGHFGIGCVYQTKKARRGVIQRRDDSHLPPLLRRKTCMDDPRSEPAGYMLAESFESQTHALEPSVHARGDSINRYA